MKFQLEFYKDSPCNNQDALSKYFNEYCADEGLDLQSIQIKGSIAEFTFADDDKKLSTLENVARNGYLYRDVTNVMTVTDYGKKVVTRPRTI